MEDVVGGGLDVRGLAGGVSLLRDLEQGRNGGVPWPGSLPVLDKFGCLLSLGRSPVFRGLGSMVPYPLVQLDGVTVEGVVSLR